MLGDEDGQLSHFGGEFLRRQYERLLVGAVGPWWHGTHVPYLVNWRLKSFNGPGVSNRGPGRAGLVGQ